jgi:hypothetical protein
MAYDAYNPTVKRYARDVDAPIPNVEYCPTELPHLHAHAAPYLPLHHQIEKHSDFYVCLTGKVVARDSYGFLVPAGYKIEQESTEALANFGTGNVNFVTADLLKYDQTDVDNKVKNSRGVQVALGEPVVYSMLRLGGVALPNFDAGVAGSSSAVDTNGVMTWAIEIGEHLGVALNSWIRNASDVISRAANSHLFNAGAQTGMNARLAEDDGTVLRNEAWELQMPSQAVRVNYCLQYPVVANRAGVLVEGQAVAIAAAMTSFKLGDRVTYDRNSDIVPHSVNQVLLAADMDGNGAATDAAAIAKAIERYHKRSVGQVIKKDTVFPRSLLDKVKTRWGSDIPGFETIDRMPGSATSGYPDAMHKAGSTLGQIVISQFMR